ncbi:thioesterase [Mycolicibacterium novocastrense]|uniref:thioesterase II family protein n=1 Tax=Mycolicibacterium novocastrense TaxID=59813 RepID=UPI000746AD5D|nr:thioesterase domain-containing protein [Mycolicibacterium novocastrense]KUH68288.1 thioesterase [Mycolicibacterium novocastrense]KUH68796.1 thioesterase [Mycolicibacterium novocastrense]KUH69413.1 thioesterase [Mycolicibacterium novocastrense]
MIDERSQLTFAPWIKRSAGQSSDGATVVFPHAGGAAAAYRAFASALARTGDDAYVVQYPQRADRLRHPAPETVQDLAADLFAAGDWSELGPLRLFGHCMGAVIAFEFGRVAERNGVPVRQLWVSASQAPSTIATSPRLPTAEAEVVANMVDLGGTDPRLLADEDFIELLVRAVRADYTAFNRYACEPDVRLAADIHTVGGRDDHRITPDMLRGWETHTQGAFTLSLFDGGHFYINDHLDAVAELVNAG